MDDFLCDTQNNIFVVGQSKTVDYSDEIESLHTRNEVLQNEADNIRKSIQKTEQQRKGNKLKIVNIEREETKVKQEIKSLEDKLSTLVQHKKEYVNGEAELKLKHDNERNKLNMIQDTLLNIEIQIEKVL